MTAAGLFQNQKPVSSSNQDPRSREPSMEDILASIRRIIADDQSQAGRSPFSSQRRSGQTPLHSDPSMPGEQGADQRSGADEEHGFEDVLDLAKMPDAVVSDAYQPAPPGPIEIEHAELEEDHVYADDERGDPVATEPAAPYMNGYANPFSLHASVEMSDPKTQSHASPAGHYAEEPSAAASQIAQANPARHDPLISPQLGASVMSAFETLAATVVLQNTEMLDRVMHELMRPLLKTWLDENLPAIVERLVRLEIERVARGTG